jgi:hypothetical protein
VTRARTWLSLAVVLALAGGAAAAPAAEGDVLEPFALEDAHGRTHRVDAAVRVVLLSRDMEGGALLKEALEGVDAAWLAERGAVYVADISRMPGLVARLFAIPRMRGRAYPVLLDRDGSVTARLPTAEGRASVIALDALRVTGVVHADSAEAVRSAIEAAAAGGLPRDEVGEGTSRAVGEEARAALGPLKRGLRAALEAALARGPAQAIDVCRVEAPRLAASAQSERVRVGRTSHRLRNPRNAPAPWLVPWLRHHEAHPEDRSAHVVALGGQRYGYAEPIFVDGLCLACHGSALAPDVADRVAALYPDDAATGFAAGDFRGLFWAEVTLPPAPAR